MKTAERDVQEIVITPEMIEAGVKRIIWFNPDADDPYRAVTEVLDTILAAGHLKRKTPEFSSDPA
jgi:hypothetical protein